MTDFSFKDEMLYLMRFISNDIEVLTNNVIDDSETDPEYSAVTAENMIICYIETMRGIGIKLPYYDVKSYFKACYFSDSDYEVFEKKREIEAQYYIGKQWHKTRDKRDKGTVLLSPNEDENTA